MNDQERCENCKYFRRLKHNFEYDVGYEESHCCVMFYHEKNGFILEVTPDGMCEMFTTKNGDVKPDKEAIARTESLYRWYFEEDDDC